MGRRKTKNKWSYKHYMVLHQLGPDILTYEIEAEGGSTCMLTKSTCLSEHPPEDDTNLVLSINPK